MRRNVRLTIISDDSVVYIFSDPARLFLCLRHFSEGTPLAYFVCFALLRFVHQPAPDVNQNTYKIRIS